MFPLRGGGGSQQRDKRRGGGSKAVGQKETSCKNSSGRGWRKQQKVRRRGGERRTGWVEMEGMLFSVGRKTQRSVDKRGNQAKVTVDSYGSSSKQVQKPPDKHVLQARLEGQASPRACSGQGLLPKAVGFLFDLVPAKIHLQRGPGPGSTAWSPGGYTQRSCTIL